MNKSILFVLAFFTSAIFAQTTTFNTNGTGATGSIQQYIINGCTSEIEIEGYGAQGGNTNGGLGARMRGRFSVAAGDTIFIVVGQQGTINQCGGINASSGGGGGSFVWKGTGPGRVLLLVAGGGGGGNMNWSGSCIDGIAAVTTNDGTQGNGPTSALGGTGGNGGFGNAPSGTGSGGAGWLTSGENSTWGSGCTGGLTYPLFTGGDGAVAFSSPGEGVGGYGGGGGAVCGNGGGGGYSGGGGGEGSSCRAGGGGGGSYNVGTSQSNTAGIQTGNGLVTITVTSSLGSGNTLSASITPNDTVCVGTMVTASGINGTSYAWNNGVVNGVPFMASSSSTYVLSAIDTAGCLDTFAIQLHVNSLPNILSNVSSNDTVCSGTTVTLFGSGGLSYTWNNSVVNNVPFIINTSGNYIVNGTDNNGCSNTDTLNMVVNTNPTILSNVLPNDTVCTGTTVTLFGSGGLSYTWNNSVINNVPFIINTSGNYIVNGTDNNGCNNADTLNVVVNTNPTVSLGADIIQSNPPAILDAGIGFTGYLWNTSAITQTISVTTNGTYNVTVTNANGCTDSDTIQVFFTAGLEDTDISSANVVIYPNPSDGIFNLSVSNIDAEKLTIKIIDINGKIILTQNLGKVEGHFMKEFDLSNLSDGSYILVFEADGKESFIRLLKQ